ncbi:ABC-2 type transport system permease protein [Paenibacillus phyllosphaerae]|uniref:ABC-2 type transport system permease protein n=1 Tax=Paenibacillus phyllosphaerae TaxID=274593 RepID=A0A7W5ASS9_9BACL|nr:ABC-2 family transporter protein [Paenibacillus phyllosphaerae]MBB3108125.1 ABC-2 type transport system permease protein [Paenibacillus phyllosphaerae]
MRKTLHRYAVIYHLFLKNSLIYMMEYRVNFMFGVLVEIGFLAIKLSYVYVVFRIGTDLNGLSPHNILLFIGTFTIMAGLYSALFFFNFNRFPELIRSGDLDIYVTKPVSLQFFTTLRMIDISFAVPNVIGGIVMVVIGWQNSGISASIGHIAGFVLFIGIGVVLTYCIFLLPQLLAFWTVRTNGINDISNGLYDFNQMPMQIYHPYIQKAGTFLLPVFLTTNYSPMVALDRLGPVEWIWGIVSPILFLIIVRLLWKLALRNYTSASS